MSLSQSDFAFVSALVRREAAIVLQPGKEYLVEARLIPVARSVGAPGVSAFLADLQRRPNPAHQRKIIDALTTNETSWFRDREPFAALTDVVLPELVKSRSATRKIRVWSAASRRLGRVARNGFRCGLSACIGASRRAFRGVPRRSSAEGLVIDCRRAPSRSTWGTLIEPPSPSATWCCATGAERA